MTQGVQGELRASGDDPPVLAPVDMRWLRSSRRAGARLNIERAGFQDLSMGSSGSWPKRYARGDAPEEILELTARIMPLILASDHPASTLLRKQYARTEVESVELTRVGFFVRFAVPPSAARATPPNVCGGHVTIELEGVEHGAGCALFVSDGVISFLEGFTYDEPFPEHPVILALRDPIPIVLHTGVSEGG